MTVKSIEINTGLLKENLFKGYTQALASKIGLGNENRIPVFFNLNTSEIIVEKILDENSFIINEQLVEIYRICNIIPGEAINLFIDENIDIIKEVVEQEIGKNVAAEFFWV